jgi:hypothetical protein
MSMSASQTTGLYQQIMTKLNTVKHEFALRLYMAIVLAHWAEHLVQAFQIYALGWARPDSRGILGQFYPWMVESEILHYAYAIVMLIGIWILKDGFVGRERKWWMISFLIQFWHHIEHAVLQIQYAVGKNLFGLPVPTSFLQLWIPRVELHLFYNTVVFIPMIVGMYYHLFPTKNDHALHRCSCAIH